MTDSVIVINGLNLKAFWNFSISTAHNDQNWIDAGFKCCIIKIFCKFSNLQNTFLDTFNNGIYFKPILVFKADFWF